MAGILQSSVGLLKSRLSRRIVFWVFLSIVLIEAAIFVPAVIGRRRDKLADLQRVSSEVLFTVKNNAMAGVSSEQILLEAEQRISPDSVILGLALYTPAGELLGHFGELPEIDASEVLGAEPVTRRMAGGQRYDVAWPSEEVQDSYVLVVRHDSSGVGPALLAFGLRIGGLVILIAGFVTLWTIVVLERLLILPILYLRDDLIEAGAAVLADKDPQFYAPSMKRRDELGEVTQAFCQMYGQIRQEICDRKQAELALREEQQKSEALLLNILPEPIAKQLKLMPGAIASRFDDVTILFADIVDFTGLAAKVSPTDLVEALNQLFSAFDRTAEALGLEKIKTIGDAYMVVGGLPNPIPQPAHRIADMALTMQTVAARLNRQDGTGPFQLRIGIHSGPVVAGVIGLKKFSYDLWGDAVNVASRMESQGTANQIQVSQASYEKLKFDYHFVPQGSLNLKGRGSMQTYLLVDKHSEI
jgi:adenylate cyclase